MLSPYSGLPVEAWEAKTRELIKQHPLAQNEIYEVVIQEWREIFHSSITSRAYKIGIDLFPSPQILGFLLHELIPLELTRRYPTVWRRDRDSTEKDLVYIPDINFSIEIKTSSSRSNTYGNRSYTQVSATGRKSKKSKSGYYLVINFQKLNSLVQSEKMPQINLVRFGWLDQEDWQGQLAATGQQARLNKNVERYKLLKLPLLE